jgi:hypothetical protein
MLSLSSHAQLQGQLRRGKGKASIAFSSAAVGMSNGAGMPTLNSLQSTSRLLDFDTSNLGEDFGQPQGTNNGESI